MHIHTYICMHIHTYIYIYMYIYVYTHTYIHMYAKGWAYKCVYMYVYIHTYIHMYTYGRGGIGLGLVGLGWVGWDWTKGKGPRSRQWKSAPLAGSNQSGWAATWPATLGTVYPSGWHYEIPAKCPRIFGDLLEANTFPKTTPNYVIKALGFCVSF